MTKRDEAMLYPKQLKERVLAMSYGELVEYCHGVICDSIGCVNMCERGYVHCTQCLHGGSQTASPIYQLAKQRMQELKPCQ
jgi:hypothetical protein